MTRVAWTVACVGGVVFVVVAGLFVPWEHAPADAVPVGSVFSAEEVARAEAYSRLARVWGWASLGVSTAALCWAGFGRRGRALVARLPGRWWLQAVLAVVLVELGVWLLTLPFAALAHRHRQDYGLTRQDWWGFAADRLRAEAIAIATLSVIVLVLVGCARRWHRAWPAVAGTIMAALVVVGSFAYPLIVEPVFNDFEPLPEGELRTEIFLLAERENVPLDDVLVADASRRTTTLNAYVSGFGGTRRVVVYDTLVDDLPREQALVVVAHELGHARNHDVVIGTALGASGALLGVGLLGLVLARRRPVGDPSVVPFLIALLALTSVATAPVVNATSRAIETRADVEALAATRDPDAFVAMQRRLALRSLADPTPPAWSHFWFGSHPTVLERVALPTQDQAGK